jgi:cation diffusion facilitator family transporter
MDPKTQPSNITSDLPKSHGRQAAPIDRETYRPHGKHKTGNDRAGVRVHPKEKNQTLMFRAVQVSLWGNIILFILKTVALILVNSLAIATDLGITVVGLIVSVILFYSVKLANRPADFLHNYGYGKVEYVCEALEGVVLFGIALLMSFQAIMHLFHLNEISAPWLGFGFSVIGSAINFAGAFWILSLARRCGSPAVRAEGVHYQLEGFISFMVAISFLCTVALSFTPLKLWTVYLDPIATLAVSLLIAPSSFRLAKHAFVKLLDASLEETGKMEVMKLLGKYLCRCCEFRDVRSRSSGRNNFVELKLVLPKALPFLDAYRLAADVERDLREKIPECEATVSIVPCSEDCGIFSSQKKCPYLSDQKAASSSER